MMDVSPKMKSAAIAPGTRGIRHHVLLNVSPVSVWSVNVAG